MTHITHEKMTPLKKYHLHISCVLLLAICHLQFAGSRGNSKALFFPGCITSGNQTVPGANLPAPITASPASGGNCNGNYTYQWLVSDDGITYTDIPGATGQNLTFSSSSSGRTEPGSVAPNMAELPKNYYLR